MSVWLSTDNVVDAFVVALHKKRRKGGLGHRTAAGQENVHVISAKQYIIISVCKPVLHLSRPDTYSSGYVGTAMFAVCKLCRLTTVFLSVHYCLRCYYGLFRMFTLR